MDSSPASGFKTHAQRIFFFLWMAWTAWLAYHYFARSPFIDRGFIENAFGGWRDARGFLILISIFSLAKSLLLDLTLFLIYWVWGRGIAKFLGFQAVGPMGPILETAMGMAGVQLFWVGWGLNRLWVEELLFPLALGALGIALWEATRVFLRRKNLNFWIPSSPFDRWMGGLCLFTVIFSFGQAALPEVYFDSLCYHLSGLNGWFQAHGITNLSTNLYTSFPFGGEMDYLGAFHWGSGEAVKGLNVGVLILLALAAGIWAWEEGGKNSAVLAAGLVLGIPLGVVSAWSAQVDILQAFFTLLFYYCMSRWSASQNQYVWVAGVLAGTVLAVKYTALLSLGVGLLVWGPILLPSVRKKPSLLLGLLVPPIVLFLPWLLKNWVYTANPLYPYLGSWFGGNGLPAEKMAELMRDHIQAFGPGETFTFWIQRVFTRDLDKTICPILFSFLPLLLIGKKVGGPVRRLLTAGGLALILSLAVSHQLRLGLGALMVCFVGMSLFVGTGLDGAWRKGWKAAALVFVVFNLAVTLRLGLLYYGDMRIWGGQQSREEYLNLCPQTMTYYPLAQDCERYFLPNEKILVAGDSRGLYYPQPVMTNSVFDPQVMAGLARNQSDGDGIALGLREMGVDGLVVLREEGNRLSRSYSHYPMTDAEWGKIDDFIQAHARLMESTPLGAIYRFSPDRMEKRHPIPDLFLCFKPISGS